MGPLVPIIQPDQRRRCVTKYSYHSFTHNRQIAHRHNHQYQPLPKYHWVLVHIKWNSTPTNLSTKTLLCQLFIPSRITHGRLKENSLLVLMSVDMSVFICEDLGTRSRYLAHAYVITSHRNCGMQLLIHALDTCFCTEVFICISRC